MILAEVELPVQMMTTTLGVERLIWTRTSLGPVAGAAGSTSKKQPGSRVRWVPLDAPPNTDMQPSNHRNRRGSCRPQTTRLRGWVPRPPW